MSKRLQLEQLRTQLASIDAIVGSLTASNLVEKHSLAARKKRLQAEMATIGATLGRSANVVLFFDGEPVRGSHGMDAGFSGAVVTHYDSLVSSIARKRAGGSRLPKMLMTRLVLGSFGVEMQEDQEVLFESPLAAAVERSTALLDSAGKDATSFVREMSDVDSDSQIAMRKFLGAMKSHGATLRIVSDASDVRLSKEHIALAHQRVSALPPREDVRALVGTFGGVLPYKRTFDFKPDDGPVITGTVDATMNAEGLIDLSLKRCGISVAVTTRTTNGTPKDSYRLVGVARGGESSAPLLTAGSSAPVTAMEDQVRPAQAVSAGLESAPSQPRRRPS